MKLHTQLSRLTSALILGASLFSGVAMADVQITPMKNVQTLNLTQQWDKIFPQSDKVEHHKVTFKNRYGITLAGDLYLPKNAKGKLPAIAVSGAFGAVKEQVSGLYAQTLAEKGFVTLAFDPSYTGESGGEPRNTASPEINTDDFSSAVDFLGLQSFVDRDKIGILGVCGWGGFALNSAIADTRIKAVATSTMYDMTRMMAKGYFDSLDAEGRYQMKQALNAQRWTDAENGTVALDVEAKQLPTPDKVPTEAPQFVKDYADFYRTERGFHPRSVNSNSTWTITTPLAFVNMPLLQYASELKTPALIVHGENAHSRYFSEDAFKALGSQDKELYIVPNASHVDLYDDKAGKIPYDKFAEFFKKHLN